MHFDQKMELERVNNPDMLLLYAAKYGDRFEFEKALEAGANPDVQDKAGMTPMMWAARSGHISIVRDLYGKGANIDLMDSKYKTALHHAFEIDHYSDMARIEELVLRSSRTVIAMFLTEMGVSQIMRDFRGNIPLHLACINSNLPAVKAMLRVHAPIKACNMNGDTPLILASSVGSHRVAAMLLDRGADIYVRNNDGNTALHLAACFGHLETVCLLLLHGADSKAKDNVGRTAKDLAYLNHYYVIAQMLEEKEQA